MIKKVFIYVGGTSAWLRLQPFLLAHKEILDESGVVVPELGSSNRCISRYDHMPLGVGLFYGDAESMEASYSQLRSLCVAHCEPDDTSLVLFMPRLLNVAQNGGLKKTGMVFLEKAFPQAEISVIGVLSRQDVEIDAYMTRFLLVGGTVFPPVNVFPSSNILRYEQTVPAIENIFGQAACHWFIDRGKLHEEEDGLINLLRFIGVQQVEYLYQPSETIFPLAQDVLLFMYFSNIVTQTEERESLIDWFQYLSFLSSGELSPFVLSPKIREKIIDTSRVASNTFLEQRKLPHFSSEPEKRNWQGFSGFTPEHVARLAKYLPISVIQQIEKGLRAIPESEKGWNTRMMEKGISLLKSSQSASLYNVQENAQVAVLTLCYNHEKFIAQNIISIAKQKTDFPFVHIIHDDGSTDKSVEIIETLAAKYPHIVFIQKKDKLAFWEGNSVRRLFEMARTPYVALCDGDDYFIDTSKLQKQYDFLKSNDRYSICFHPVSMIWENKQKEDGVFPLPVDLPPHKPPYYLADLIRWNFMSTSSVMYRWRFADGLPSWFCSSALPGDWYWHMLHAEVGRIGMLDDIMSVYRRHDGGIWKYAEVDLVKHKENHGIQELRTYIAMDEQFNGRFRNIFEKRILYEFSMLYELSAYHDIPKPFEDAVREFPEWATRVVEQIKMQMNNG